MVDISAVFIQIQPLTTQHNVKLCNHLRRVRDIFGELMVALDHTVAPELSNNLARLYTWLIAELGRAGMERSPERLDDTIAVTQNLLDGWSQAFRNDESR